MSSETQPSKRAKVMAAWTPSSWQPLPKVQMAEYEDKELTAKVLGKLSSLPPLVQPNEAERLKSLLAAAARGERFIVQGGDCAERFMDCRGDRLEAQVSMMLQMGMIMETITGRPNVCICRIAGQYGKPRSKPTEVVEGYGEIMSFKGENINGYEPTDRKWDPERLLQGYWHSAATLNFLRGFVASADPMVLSKVELGQLTALPDFDKLKATARDVSAKFAMGKEKHEFFTAHEAMQLDLEEALTRKAGDKYYNLSAHLVWIGDRTRQIDGAHVEYFRGLSNPVGCKIGPSMKNDELKELVQKLNPNKEEGKLMLITRYGAGKVADMLPGHIEAVKASGVPVVWQCDAVHGNGIVATNKYKTRKVSDILSEIMECIEVHKKCGTVLAGIHLECTGQSSVTECLGGCMDLTEDQLPNNYETYCDPRLNYAQSIEASFQVASSLKK